MSENEFSWKTQSFKDFLCGPKLGLMYVSNPSRIYYSQSHVTQLATSMLTPTHESANQRCVTARPCYELRLLMRRKIYPAFPQLVGRLFQGIFLESAINDFKK